MPTNTQWCFDIQWCPRNPAVLSAASFDGRISVYSIMGGSTDGLRQKQVDQVLRSTQLRKVDGKRKKHGLGETSGGCCNSMLTGVLIQCKKMMLLGLSEMVSQNFPILFYFVKAFVLVWEPGSVWYRTAPPTPAAPPADCPTERCSAPKEATQMDPATCGSIVLGKQGPRLAGQGARQW